MSDDAIRGLCGEYMGLCRNHLRFLRRTQTPLCLGFRVGLWFAGLREGEEACVNNWVAVKEFFPIHILRKPHYLPLGTRMQFLNSSPD